MNTESDPRILLDLRFARGDINAEEYRFRQDMLERRSAGVVDRAEPR